MTIKVGYIEPIGNHGGMNYYDDGLAMGLVKNGGEAYLFSNYTSEYTTKSFPFFQKQWTTKNNLLKVIYFYISFFKTIFQLKKEKIKVAHLHSFKDNWRLASQIFLLRILGFRIVITNHDVSAFSGQDSTKAAQYINQNVDKIVLHNHFSKNIFVEKFPQFHNKCLVIPHGNYIPFIPQIQSSTPKKANIFSILFFGQIKEVKGLEVLLKGFAIFAKGKQNIQLTIAGKVWKDDFSKYQKIIDEEGISSISNLQIRYIHDDEVPHLYQQADIIVLPYKLIFQSGVLLHSMSFRCPVLVSDLAPFLEIVDDKRNGFVFENNNPQDLANQLDYIYTHQEQLPLIAKNAFDDMQQYFDWSIIGKKLMDNAYTDNTIY